MNRPDKPQLLKKYAEARIALRTFIDSHSEFQLTVPTDEGEWTVKDHLVHIAVWQEGITALLLGKNRWSAMGLSADVVKSGDYDEMNERIREKTRSLTLKQVLKRINDADTRFTAALKKTTAASLRKPYAQFARIRKPSDDEMQPVFGWVEAESWQHIEEHLPWMHQIIVDDRAAKLTLYGAGYRMLEAALAEAPRDMWKFRPAEGAWSVHEIIVHLADSELNSYARVRKALAEPGSTIFGYDQDQWAVALDYHRRDTGDALALLRLVRKMTHELLAGQPADVWARSYFHPEMQRQVTLNAWLDIYSSHIPSHIDQIYANVEAWRATQTA